MIRTRVYETSQSPYLHVRVEGHEDWQSAIENVESVLSIVAAKAIERIFLDFSGADIRYAKSEVPDIARIFGSEASRTLELGMILPDGSASRERAEEMARALAEQGHSVVLLADEAGLNRWAAGGH
jgi:hypothetical protein